MQLCSVDLAQMKLVFSEKEEPYVLFDALVDFYCQLSRNNFWRPLLMHGASLGRTEIVLVIEKQYERQVKGWLKQAAEKIGSKLEIVDPPEGMVAEIDREVLSFLKDMAR